MRRGARGVVPAVSAFWWMGNRCRYVGYRWGGVCGVWACDPALQTLFRSLAAHSPRNCAPSGDSASGSGVFPRSNVFHPRGDATTGTPGQYPCDCRSHPDRSAHVIDRDEAGCEGGVTAAALGPGVYGTCREESWPNCGRLAVHVSAPNRIPSGARRASEVLPLCREARTGTGETMDALVLGSSRNLRCLRTWSPMPRGREGAAGWPSPSSAASIPREASRTRGTPTQRRGRAGSRWSGGHQAARWPGRWWRVRRDGINSPARELAAPRHPSAIVFSA